MAQGPKGTIVRAGGKDGPQRIATSGQRWSEEAEDLFIDRLSASCNVTLAAAATGFSREAIYKRRRTDARFARRWQAAIAQGYARIEALLVDTAEAALEGTPRDPDSPIPPMTARDAIAVLKLHRDEARGGAGRRPGWRGRPRSLDEVRDSILRKLSALERARALPSA